VSRGALLFLTFDDVIKVLQFDIGSITLAWIVNS
jgi:hypothetical protein